MAGEILFPEGPHIVEHYDNGMALTVSELTISNPLFQQYANLQNTTFPEHRGQAATNLMRGNRVPPLVWTMFQGNDLIGGLTVSLARSFSTVPDAHKLSVLQLTDAAVRPDYQNQGVMGAILDRVFKNLPRYACSQLVNANLRAFEPLEQEDFFADLSPQERKQLILDSMEQSLLLTFDTALTTGHYTYAEQKGFRVGQGFRNSIWNNASANGWLSRPSYTTSIFGEMGQLEAVLEDGQTYVFATVGEGSDTQTMGEVYVDQHGNPVNIPVRIQSEYNGVYPGKDQLNGIKKLVKKANSNGLLSAKKRNEVAIWGPGHNANDLAATAVNNFKLAQGPSVVRMAFSYNW